MKFKKFHFPGLESQNLIVSRKVKVMVGRLS